MGRTRAALWIGGWRWGGGISGACTGDSGCRPAGCIRARTKEGPAELASVDNSRHLPDVQVIHASREQLRLRACGGRHLIQSQLMPRRLTTESDVQRMRHELANQNQLRPGPDAKPAATSIISIHITAFDSQPTALAVVSPAADRPSRDHHPRNGHDVDGSTTSENLVDISEMKGGRRGQHHRLSSSSPQESEASNAPVAAISWKGLASCL